MEEMNGTALQQRLRWIVLLAALVLFAADLAYILTGASAGLDEAAAGAIQGLRGPVMNKIGIAVTQLASTKWICGWILLLLILPMTRKKVGVPMLGFQLVFFLWYRALKSLIARPRPDSSVWLVTEHGWSCPSGHSMNGLIFWWMLSYLIRRAFPESRAAEIFSKICLVIPFLVGLSRVFAGVHYITDVFAGWTMGIACVMIGYNVYEFILCRKKEGK